MSNLLWILWKSLIISPTVLGATLIVSTLGARAADSIKPPLAEKQAVTGAVELSTAEVESTQNKSVPMAAEAKAAPVSSEPVVAGVEVAKEVALSATQLDLDQVSVAEVEATAPMSVEPVVEPTLAQATPAAPNDAQILDQINRYGSEGAGDSQGQVTNVGQLRDVSPGDWAYEALRSLVERYGCIAGYPDGTYRGNRALTRYEFAAGLNACLQQIERLIAGGGPTGDGDLETLRRLIQEFEAELATLGARVDNLEGRVAFLEDNQFSTTTKLSGEVIFALTDTFGGDDETFEFAGTEIDVDDDTNTIFGDRVRLELNTSFTGQDRLVTRLAAGNLDAFRPGSPTINGESFNTAEAFQTFNLGNTGNDVIIDWLAYYFPFGSSKVYLAATGGIHSDYAPTLNPYFEDYDGGNGALSTFASENPIYRIGGGAGGAISLGVGPLERVLGPSTLTVGYLAGPDAANPGDDNGVFNGEYAALAQLNFNLGDRIGIGATYVHAYHNTGSDIFDLGGGDGGAVVGTYLANNPSGVASLLNPGVLNETPTVTNSYGVELAFRLSENISISGFGTYTDAILIGQGGAEIWTYGAGVALSDFGKEGNILGVFGGVQPYLGNTDTPGQDFRRGDTDDLPWHVEAFYKYQVTDNISVTPGVIWLMNPNQGGDDAFVGTLRTTFKF
ncbi:MULTISPECIES: iron uptake porin [unclassified Coleofasciculus]|uniref:iron uptake porin n=1 Tax=unclassified Coleofasciculus TaxID=2692782 RepID=UPI001880DFDC|nr:MULTISPECIES: iron uptake porin [unclassified Coleofasciculus]MBE9128069.1 iron uptake porin [Coleofasciculus sp. LEGE 07081]MBE9149328.1 iron uptake porin [Coleofasciculus sp. LEGE 07092]